MAKDNLKQATKKSIQQSNIDKLDAFGSKRGDFETADMFSALENDVSNFLERVHTNINNTDMVTTGNISDLKMEVTDSSINILGNSYLIYIDSGVNGSQKQLYDTPFAYSDKMPPASAFYHWIDRKNINLRNEEFYGGNPSDFEEFDEEQAKRNLSYALAVNAYKNGIRPQPVFKKEIPELIEDAKKTLGNFTKDMLTSSIRNKYGQDVFKRSTR